MSEIQYTSVNRILAKFHRDLKGNEINESDAIEWIGEALEFLKVPQVQEQSITFVEVQNYEAEVPEGLQLILQIAKHNNWDATSKEDCIIPVPKKDEPSIILPSQTDMTKETCEQNDTEYKPYFDMQWQYIDWTQTNYYQEHFQTVRLANNVFFNSLVCREKSPYVKNQCNEEYTIVGTVDKKLRFSFKEGYVAIAYIKNALDKETGYPLIPDNISYTTAITYYIKWKIAEQNAWNGREGFAQLAQDSERKWLKYVRQAKNYMKMPKSLDDFQDLLEQSHYLIPNHKRYYNYFGNLNKREKLKF